MSAASSPQAKSLAECRALLASQPKEKSTALCFYDLALGEADGGPAAEALERLSQEHENLPWLTYYVANLHWRDAALAARLYAHVAEEFARDGDLEGEIQSRINRSQRLVALGRNEEARAEAETVYRLAEGSEDRLLRAWGQLTLARQLLHSGRELGRAYDILLRIDPPPGEQGDSLRRDRLALLGSVSIELGRFAQAERAYREALALAQQRDDQWGRYAEATARYGLARTAYQQLVETPSPARRAEVAQLARETLRAAQEAGHREVQAYAYWLLAQLEPGPESERLLEDCLRVARNARLESYCLNPLARHRASTDPVAALRMLDRSFALARRTGDEWAEIFVWQERLPVYWEAEDPLRALTLSRKALDSIEELRDRQEHGSPAQAALFSRWSDLYAWLAGRLLKSGEGSDRRVWASKEAFRVDERMRARSLTDWLRRANAEYRSATGGGDFADLEQVQRALGSDEALLSFQVAPWEGPSGRFGGGSWLMTITRHGARAFRLPGRTDIRRAVRLFEGLVEQRDGSEAEPGARLYKKLLAPALSELPPEVKRLVLVPDDALHRLPFAALRPTADGTPLGARYELVRVPSATLWLRWRSEEPATARKPVLVLADPTLNGGAIRPPEEEDAPSAASAESPGGSQLAQVRGADKGTEGQPGTAFGPLTYAREEGRFAMRDLGGGLFLAGPEATEERLVSLDLSSFSLIHFAAHAVTDEDRPERSAVLLASDGTGESGPHDGRLESSEIARLKLGGRTVVLASCRSAGGTVLLGEGVMSLARAFFQAGAHGVVASLWPLRDDESAALFRRFYRHLAAGETVAGALHTARQEAIAAGEPAAAWAGLVVLGDGALVPVPGGRWIRPSASLVAAVVVVLLAALVIATWLWGALRRRGGVRRAG